MLVLLQLLENYLGTTFIQKIQVNSIDVQWNVHNTDVQERWAYSKIINFSAKLEISKHNNSFLIPDRWVVWVMLPGLKASDCCVHIAFLSSTLPSRHNSHLWNSWCSCSYSDPISCLQLQTYCRFHRNECQPHFNSWGFHMFHRSNAWPSRWWFYSQLDLNHYLSKGDSSKEYENLKLNLKFGIMPLPFIFCVYCLPELDTICWYFSYSAFPPFLIHFFHLYAGSTPVCFITSVYHSYNHGVVLQSQTIFVWGIYCEMNPMQ